MSDDLKEFIDDNEALARAKAARHLNVSEAELDAKLIPPELEIHGLGGRVVVLAEVKRAAPILGPVGEFVRDLVGKMGVENISRIEERKSDGQILVTVDAARLAGIARDHKGLMPALSHLAERAAEKLGGGGSGDGETSVRVELAGRGPDRDRGRGGRDGREGRGGRGGREGRDGRGGRDRGGDRGPRRGRDGERGGGRANGAEALDSGPQNPELEQLARDSGRQVLQTGESATLDEMSSRDRWVVHNALKEVDGVQSESVGDGPLKRVKIFPA